MEKTRAYFSANSVKTTKGKKTKNDAGECFFGIPGLKCLLETPNYNLGSVAAPRLWNSLPMELKTSTSIDIFKKKLKTYLFKHSYF